MSIDLDYIIGEDVALVDGVRYVRERTCSADAVYDLDDINKNGRVLPDTWYFAFSCGHELYWDAECPPNYCPECGAKVVDE